MKSSDNFVYSVWGNRRDPAAGAVPVASRMGLRPQDLASIRLGAKRRQTAG
jgi:hypothetical protein